MRVMSMLIIFFLLNMTVVATDGEHDWNLIVFDHQQHQLHRITATGIENTLQLNADNADSERLKYFATSNDGQYFAYGTYEQALGADGWLDYSSTVYLVDLNAWMCCESVTVADPFPDEQTIYSVLAFSPDDTQMILRASGIPEDGESSRGSEILIIIDIVSGMIRHEIRWAMDNEVVRWTEDGILFREVCNGFSCGGADNPPSYLLWDPIAETSESYIPSLFPLEMLDTGETLQVIQTESHDGECCLFALEYSALEMDSAYKIYTDEDTYRYGFESHWVANGQHAVLLPLAFDFDTERFGEAGLLLSRDGSEVQFSYAISSQWLAQTPDGWLTTDNLRNRLVHFKIEDDLSILQSEIEITANIRFTERNIVLLPTSDASLHDLIVFSPVSDLP